jgi:zinc/manganese transport system substrate-binding protein
VTDRSVRAKMGSMRSELCGKLRKVALLSLFVSALLVSGCGGQDQGSSKAAASSKLRVVATTTQIGDFVRQVGGDAVDAHQILQPNSDPHDYEPRPADVEATAGAAVVFVNGDSLDSWMDQVVSESGGSPTVVDLGEGMPERLPGETSGEEASTYDPHWWHDPRNAEAAVNEIRDAMVEADPDHASDYQQNADTYLAKIEELDEGIQNCTDRIPADQRKLVTDHDAFNYFANRYGIEVVGAVIPSQSTQAQPSAGEVADLISLIKDQNVKAVFPESSVNPDLAQTIARETGASADYTLYGDTLGEEGSNGDTYLKMEAANADAMVRGFSGGQDSCSISVSG